MILPAYTHNGSSPARHAEQHAATLDALRVTREALALGVPNGRDYASEADLRIALAEHAARLAALESVEREIIALARHARRAAHTSRTGGGTP